MCHLHVVNWNPDIIGTASEKQENLFFSIGKWSNLYVDSKLVCACAMISNVTFHMECDTVSHLLHKVQQWTVELKGEKVVADSSR